MDNYINKLNILDFSPGIRAEEINENFDLIKRWIEAERIRIGGWGLVEGFDLSADLTNFTITVSNGIMINQAGEEVKVSGTKIMAGPPVFKNITEEHVIKEDGSIELQFAPYSDINKHTIIYNPPDHVSFNEEELTITDIETGMNLTLRDIRFIDENVIIVNSEYAEKRVRIQYLYANDRIDAIFLKKDGSEYIYEKGIISTSPSQEVIQDYLKNGYYLIGLAYWHIGKTIKVDFITADRTLRPIYVDENGNIFLNGKLYKGYKFIYFEEPKNPEPNDLWYDTVNEILYIWRPDENGKYRWTPINDLSRFNREYGCFNIKENPQDLRTFMFDEKPNLRFVPGYNQLTIIIDQVVLMRDQYEEIFDPSKFDEDICSGKGFRLKQPLERPSVVEVLVDHSINTKGQKLELFPHISSFLKIESIEVNDNTVKRINTEGEYEIGNNQLEVWINGRHLVNKTEFIETKKDFVPATENDLGKLSDAFEIKAVLNVGDIITYKITRYMATYDHLRKITDALNKRVDDAVRDLHAATDELHEVITNTSTALDDLKVRVKGNEDNIAMLNEEKISEVALKDILPEVKQKLVADKKCFVQNITSNQISLPMISRNDFVSIYYIDGQTTRMILIENEDYVIVENGTGIIVELESYLIGNENAKLYIEAVMIGVE